MKDYSIELFREQVARDLNILKTSNLKKVNLKLYNELMEMFDNLDKNISLYETKTGKVTRDKAFCAPMATMRDKERKNPLKKNSIIVFPLILLPVQSAFYQ